VAKGCVGGGTTGKEGEGELEMVGRICRSNSIAGLKRLAKGDTTDRKRRRRDKVWRV
jgi:hypothetical protein